MKLQPCHLDILRYAARHAGHYVEATSLSVPRSSWATLVRWGLLQSVDQSEQVRGERRVHWRIYRITAAGLTALEAA